MNYQRLFMIAISLLAFAGLSLQAQTKVAVINVQQALLDTDEVRKASADVEAKYKPRQEQLQKMQNELQDIQKKLQAGQGTLTPQAEADLTYQAQKLQRDLQRGSQDLQDEVNLAHSNILNAAGRRMQEIVQKIADANGYDVVLDAAATVLTKPAADITTQAVAEYNKAHPAAAPAAAPAK